MKVSDSVRLSLDELESQEFESAMLHACNAVDGTAKRASTQPVGVRQRFTELLREHADVLGRLGMPGIDIARTKFPIRTREPAYFEMLDIPSVLYRIHRCTHGHGDELPGGFDLIPERTPGLARAQIDMKAGTIRLPESIIIGLLGIAVMHPVNKSQRINSEHFLLGRFYSGRDGPFGRLYIPIDEWWGRVEDYRRIAAGYPPTLVTMDMANPIKQIEASGGTVIW